MWKRWAVTVAAMSQVTACCVARGTRVKTPKGLREVELLGVGDEVTVVDPQTRELGVGKVSAIRTRPRECARLWTRLGPLTLTTDHPLYDPSRAEWAAAGDWVLGLRSAVLLVEGDAVAPGVVVRAERFVGLEDVFDLTVDHPHHDFVAEGVLVHNKPPIQAPCAWPDGGLTEPYAACACADGRAGVTTCNGNTASCFDCPTTALPTRFASAWNNDAGVTDHGQWQLACGPTDALSVVPGEPLGFQDPPQVLRLTQPEDGGCAELVRRGLLEPDRSHFGRLYFRGDADGGLQRVVQLGSAGVPWLTVLGREDVDGGQRLVLAPPGDGGLWRTPPLPKHTWVRYEWRFSVTTGARFQLWPRLSDGRLTELDARAWTRDDGTTLDAWYSSGHVFSMPPDAGLLDLSLGLAPAEASGDVFCADLAIGTSDWLGP